MGYAQLSEGHVEKLDVIEELDRAIARVFPPAAGFAVKVHREYAPPFPPLVMQRRHLFDAFVNVLQNAATLSASQAEMFTSPPFAVTIILSRSRFAMTAREYLLTNRERS